MGVKLAKYAYAAGAAPVRPSTKATGISRSGIPGNREPPKFPAGIPVNF